MRILSKTDIAGRLSIEGPNTYRLGSIRDTRPVIVAMTPKPPIHGGIERKR